MTASDVDDLLGSRLQAALGSDYTVDGTLGAGGFAVVYLVRDLQLKRTLAVKVLSPDVVASPTARERFKREAETIAQLVHPHIVPLHFVGHQGDLVYLAMQAVDGGSLAQRLEKEGRLPIDDTARVFGEVASALAHAHKRGVMHRDIKPQNVLLDAESGRALVTDFGIARTLEGAELTATGMIVGTPAYISPEQATGEHSDHRADIYSLGVMVYEMLAGRVPFTGQTPTAVMMKRLGGPPAPIRSIRPDVPSGLAELVQSCLATDPRDRISDAGEIARQLAGPVSAAASPRTARLRVARTPEAGGSSPGGTPATAPRTPHVGRVVEQAAFRDWLAAAAAGQGGVMLVAGASGIGKTRLVTTIAASAERSGWQCGLGRVYAVETGVPYAVWADALTTLLMKLDPEARRVLTRGGSWLGTICPAFATESPAVDADAHDGKARLLWHCAQFVTRLGDKQPLLLVLENLHLADSASLELLHFVARQVTGHRVGIVGTYAESELDQQPMLRDIEQSLLALGAGRLLRLEALTQAETEQLVCETFGVEHAAARQLARRVYSWTRGHPFFVEEALKTLVERGRLRLQDGRWIGWEVEELDLPRTVRLAVSQRLERLSTDAHAAAGAAAVIGARVRFDVLCEAAELATDTALAAVEELQRAGILTESARSTGATSGSAAEYEFAHPILQDVVYEALGPARARLLHTRVARALESELGGRAASQADLLAFHFLRADPEEAGDRTVRYLAAAGRDALARHADRAAAEYLAAALDRAPGAAGASSLIDDLAQARQRLGDYDGALSLLERARSEATAAGDIRRRARVERRMGLACYWGGRFDEALAHLDAALATAAAAGDAALHAQLRINRGSCWQSLGKPGDAAHELREALAEAMRLGDEALLARSHRALLLLHIFVGPPETARAHGEQALEMARRVGDRTALWSARMGLATLGGLTGDVAMVLAHLPEAEELSDELQSPLLRAYADEIRIWHQFASGEWDGGIVLAERAITTARTLNQRTLLPRVLVWATNFYLARGEHERAKRYLDEAWEVGVAGASQGQPIEVHSQLAVYAGLAAYYLVIGDYQRAVATGEQGLAIADKVGYTVWATFRLLPVTIEATFWTRDWDRARALRNRLQRECQQMNNRLGLIWVTAGDGIIARMEEDYRRAAALLRSAVDDLEQVPWLHDAARLRRWLSDVLFRLGDREGGTAELRRSHETCARLGALVELNRAREMMKTLGLRPPTRASGKRARLTVRESDIARLVIERKSNKEIAAALGIATRTVTTHVANIFAKLGVNSRGELADRLRDESSLDGGTAQGTAAAELT